MELAHQDFLPISAQSTISGSINCSSAAPAIASDAGSSIFISLTNPNYEGSIKYAIYSQATGHVESKGSLSKGNSKSVIIPASNTPHILRIQNQSECDPNHITPTLSFVAAVQQG